MMGVDLKCKICAQCTYFDHLLTTALLFFVCVFFLFVV